MTYKHLTALLLTLTLAACGIKGDLYLPGDKEKVGQTPSHPK